MKKNLKWRLKEQPSTESLRALVKDGILTKEQAKDILFTEEEDRDIESLKQEIKFLREVIEKLGDRPQIVRLIKDKDYNYPWYSPYITWRDATGGTSWSFTGISTF